MHLSSLQREQENRFRKNIPKNFSATSFTPMQRDGFNSSSKWAGFFRPTGYKPMIVLFFFFLIQQFSGIYITLFYAVTFFQVSHATFGPTYISLLFHTSKKNFNCAIIIWWAINCKREAEKKRVTIIMKLSPIFRTTLGYWQQCECIPSIDLCWRHTIHNVTV